MSLLPRTTLHSYSEHCLVLGSSGLTIWETFIFAWSLRYLCCSENFGYRHSRHCCRNQQKNFVEELSGTRYQQRLVAEVCGDLPTPLIDGQTSWVYPSTLVQSLYISCYVYSNKLVLSYLSLRLLPQVHRKSQQQLIYCLDHRYGNNRKIQKSITVPVFRTDLKSLGSYPDSKTSFLLKSVSPLKKDQLVAEKCFASHKMADGQILMIFSMTTD